MFRTTLARMAVPVAVLLLVSACQSGPPLNNETGTFHTFGNYTSNVSLDPSP